MRSTIYFNGKSSADFGLIVEYFPESVHAARRGELIPIPGRNGVIIREDGAFDTYQQTFQIWFRNTLNQDTFQIARSVAEWLLGVSGFCRLEDTYEPEYFRMARFVGPLNVETVLRDHGRATLEFDVQPQRYLKSGETPISYEGDSTTAFSIVNPTRFEARPLLKFVDTAQAPSPTTQTLEMQEDVYISATGDVSEVVDPSSISMYQTSLPVAVTGSAYAILTGNGYAFLDNTGKTKRGGFIYTGGKNFKQEKIVVPSWAESIVVSSIRNNITALSLQEATPNPGLAAATINGTTINLDFRKYDTIYLDCDLHDAYYIDGSSANSAVSFASNLTDYPTFPGLAPGLNTIIPGDGSNLDFELTPRWWTL